MTHLDLERSLFGLPQDELDRLMVEMDKNGDGEIEFEEFAVAMSTPTMTI